ncbi:MAG: hypothetical protein ABSC94_18970 [Polyangiaceae bacterium]|jgi:hypothetical protein
MAVLTLLDPGKPPRSKLRYVWNAGQREELTIDLRTVASSQLPNAQGSDIALPPVHIVVAISPSGVADNGDLEYAWRVTSTEVKADPTMPPELARGMKAEVDAVERLSGSGVVTPLGLARRVSIETDTPSDAGVTGQMVEQVRQTLRDMAAPFPDEAVGMHARWQKLSHLSTKDAEVTQTETFTLVSLGAKGGTLDDVLAQTSPPQPIHGPGMAAGAQTRMDSMLVSGDAKTTFDRSRLVPQTSLESTTSIVLSGHSLPGDSNRRMDLLLRVHISLTGSIR